MKKIILMLVLLFGLISCGINCPSKLEARAYYYQGKSSMMTYHIGLFFPLSSSSHSPSLKCPRISYLKLDVYTDKLGNVNGDEVIFEDHGYRYNLDQSVKFFFGKDEVRVNNISDPNVDGIYKVERSSPNSWGVPID